MHHSRLQITGVRWGSEVTRGEERRGEEKVSGARRMGKRRRGGEVEHKRDSPALSGSIIHLREVAF